MFAIYIRLVLKSARYLSENEKYLSIKCIEGKFALLYII